MKKGFTLIELLAVIVVLAVIALIATPLVLNVISSTKEEADRQGINAYIDAADTYFAEAEIKNSELNTNVIDKLGIKNGNATGSVIVNSDGTVEMAVVLNNKCYLKTAAQDKKDITVTDDITNCIIHKYPVPDKSCFTYTKIDDNNMAITGYNCGNSMATYSFDPNDLEKTVVTYNNDGTYLDIEIPSTIDGIPVTTIMPLAFLPGSADQNGNLTGDYSKRVGIRNISLPASVTTIMDYAFAVNEIENLYMTDNVTSIGE